MGKLTRRSVLKSVAGTGSIASISSTVSGSGKQKSERKTIDLVVNSSSAQRIISKLDRIEVEYGYYNTREVKIGGGENILQIKDIRTNEGKLSHFSILENGRKSVGGGSVLRFTSDSDFLSKSTVPDDSELMMISLNGMSGVETIRTPSYNEHSQLEAMVEEDLYQAQPIYRPNAGNFVIVNYGGDENYRISDIEFSGYQEVPPEVLENGSVISKGTTLGHCETEKENAAIACGVTIASIATLRPTLVAGFSLACLTEYNAYDDCKKSHNDREIDKCDAPGSPCPECPNCYNNYIDSQAYKWDCASQGYCK